MGRRGHQTSPLYSRPHLLLLPRVVMAAGAREVGGGVVSILCAHVKPNCGMQPETLEDYAVR